MRASGSSSGDPLRRRDFVARHTRLTVLPGVPELRLYLADELTPIWEMTEEELGERGVPPPFWAFAWAGGKAVARYLLDEPDAVAGRTVLDLAAGSGLCAIAAMCAGARQVIAADVDPFAGAAVALNAEANGVAVEVTDTDMLDGEPPDVDVVLAGDVCYERRMAARMLGWLRLARQRGSVVLLGDPGRMYLPADGLRPLAEYDVPTTPEVEQDSLTHTTVYALELPAQPVGRSTLSGG